MLYRTRHTCPFCQEQISAKATVCPHCTRGVEPSKEISVGKLVITLLAILLVVGSALQPLTNSGVSPRDPAAALSDPAAYVAAHFTADQQRIMPNYATLDGMSLSVLHRLAARGYAEFHLSTVLATGFALELGELATKAGDPTKADSALGAFLNLGAARGMSAQETLDALRQLNGSEAPYKRAIGE